MIRSALYLVALSLVVSPVACKKKDDAEAKKSAKNGDDTEENGKKKKKADDDSEEPADDDSKKGKATKGCKLPDHVEADVVIKEGCKLTVKSRHHINNGATLTIEEGAKLSFEADGSIFVEYGRLVAKGSEDKPITFTSAGSSPHAGDWDGLIFGEKVSAGTILDHVLVEYAGHEGGYGHGAIMIYGDPSAGRITITNSTFQHNENTAINAQTSKGKFAKLEGNTFKDNGGSSLFIDPDILGSVGSNKFDEPIKVRHGTVTSSAKWPKAPAFIVEDHLEVSGKGQAAVLTLPDKATMKFTAGKHLLIGGADGGGLAANGVTFTSANASPAAGDWEGIIFEAKAGNTLIEDCTIEYAGHDGGWGKGAVSFYGEEPKKLKGVKITGCKFRHNEHASIDAHGKECGDLEKDNKFDDKTHCFKE